MRLLLVFLLVFLPTARNTLPPQLVWTLRAFSWYHQPQHAYMLTTVFLHAYVLTCLLATPCSPTLTHIETHLTPCDASSTGVRHTFRFLVFAFWFSIPPLVFDSVFFQIFPALLTVPWGPGVPSQTPKLQNHPLFATVCRGAIIPCTACNRISRGDPQPQLETTASFRLRLFQIMER